MARFNKKRAQHIQTALAIETGVNNLKRRKSLRRYKSLNFESLNIEQH